MYSNLVDGRPKNHHVDSNPEPRFCWGFGKTVLKALRSDMGWKTFSFRCPHVPTMILLLKWLHEDSCFEYQVVGWIWQVIWVILLKCRNFSNIFSRIWGVGENQNIKIIQNSFPQPDPKGYFPNRFCFEGVSKKKNISTLYGWFRGAGIHDKIAIPQKKSSSTT